MTKNYDNEIGGISNETENDKEHVRNKMLATIRIKENKSNQKIP